MLVYRQGKHVADGTRRTAARTGAAAFRLERRHDKTNEKERISMRIHKITRRNFMKAAGVSALAMGLAA